MPWGGGNNTADNGAGNYNGNGNGNGYNMGSGGYAPNGYMPQQMQQMMAVPQASQ